MHSKIPFKSFDVHITPTEPIILPTYKGSTFRGGFGNAFKRVVCALKNRDCAECILKEKCAYSYIFETPPPSNTRMMRKYTSAPHPFIIEPPPEKKRDYTPKDKLSFTLTLVGKSIDYLPYFVYTLDELGNMGIGKGRGKYRLDKVKSRNRIIYDRRSKTVKPFKNDSLPLKFSFTNGGTHKHESVTLNFLTPARIMYNGNLASDLEFHILIRNLLRRLSLLSYFHCDEDTSDWDFNGIINSAKNVKVKSKNLKWYDWERYSARQNTRMKLGGFVGKITFEGNIGSFMPLLRAGEVLHVGKGTAFGLGKYNIQ